MSRIVLKSSVVVFLFCLACGSEAPFRRGESTVSPLSSILPQNAGTPQTPAPQDPPPDSPPQPVQELDKNYFEQAVLPMLEKKCSACHDNPAANFEEAKKSVVFKDPENSELYKYATGAGNVHRKVLKEGMAELAVLVSWINGGVLHP